MALSKEFADYVLEQLRRVTAVRGRRMFGGMGLYAGEVFFAILKDDTLYLRVDDGNRPDYERAGMQPFKPYRDRPIVFQYYELPAEVLEDEDALRIWIGRSAQAAAAEPPARSGRRRHADRRRNPR